MPPSDAPRFVYAVALRVAEALEELTLQRSLWTTYDSTDTRKPQISVSDRKLDTSGPRATDMMKWEVGGRYLADPGCDAGNAAE